MPKLRPRTPKEHDNSPVSESNGERSQKEKSYDDIVNAILEIKTKYQNNRKKQ